MAKRRNVRRRNKVRRGFMSWAPWKKALAVTGGVLILLTTAGVAFAASKWSKLDTTKLDTTKLNISTEVKHNEKGYLNVVLFGLDSRDNSLGEGDRSDTIMIASLNRETKEVKLCSVYRDTVLQQPDGSYNKANAAYSTDDAEGAVAMLNKNLDMDLKHYVTVNFNVLVDVVDELGGVEVDLTPEEVGKTNGYCTETSRVTGKKTTELTKPGKQILDGVQATAYCRIRQTAGDDFRRTERQRTVLEQIVKKAQSADLSTINRIIDKVFPKIATNFTLPEILAYAKDAFSYKITDMNGFPFEKTTPTLSGVGSSVVADNLAENVTQLHQFFFGSVGYKPSSTVEAISSAVQNFATGNVTNENPSIYDAPEGSNDYGSGTGGGGNDVGYTAPSGGTDNSAGNTVVAPGDSNTAGNSVDTGNTGSPGGDSGGTNSGTSGSGGSNNTGGSDGTGGNSSGGAGDTGGNSGSGSDTGSTDQNTAPNN